MLSQNKIKYYNPKISCKTHNNPQNPLKRNRSITKTMYVRLLRQAAANFRGNIGRAFQQLRSPSSSTITSRTIKVLFHHNCGSNARTNYGNLYIWTVFSTAVLGVTTSPTLADEVVGEPNSGKDMDGEDIVGLQKVEDGSVISNTHTIKWRIFTDHGRDSSLQGKFAEAERFFLSAIEEARLGFGEKDPHVASACNNLAELYRVKKAFDKAEPLYLEAIAILEESFGPDDVRVGAALHNLGQFYLVQRKLEDASKCYEKALKIKRRVLGNNNPDYADTMYHLGTVRYLQEKEDSEALIQDSIRILEEGGQAESNTCIRRMRYLAQIYCKSNRLSEAENVQRKILRVMELTKGWNTLHTVIAAEGLALTLQSAGSFRESQELLERCLEARKRLLPEDHIQIGANMLHIARVIVLNCGQLSRNDGSTVVAEYDKAKDVLEKSIRIAQAFLDKLIKEKGYMKRHGRHREATREGHEALLILLQSLNALAVLEIEKQKLQVSASCEQKEDFPINIAEKAFSQCISLYKKYRTDILSSGSTRVKAEYLSCLKNFLNLISERKVDRKLQYKSTLQELKDEIKHVEAEISSQKGSKS